MTDIYNGPASNAIAIPDASLMSTTTFEVKTRAIYVAVEGDIVVQMNNSPIGITFKGVPSGTILPIAITAVVKAGTTATGLVGLL